MLITTLLFLVFFFFFFFFFFSSRRRHTRWNCDWSSDVCSSDLFATPALRQQSRQKSLSHFLHSIAFLCKCSLNAAAKLGPPTKNSPAPLCKLVPHFAHAYFSGVPNLDFFRRPGSSVPTPHAAEPPLLSRREKNPMVVLLDRSWQCIHMRKHRFDGRQINKCCSSKRVLWL